MKRGEVWWIVFNKGVGGEIQKTRPAIIISNDASNKFLNRVQVIPLTTKTEKLYPSEAYIKVAGKQSKAMTNQIITVSKHRLTNKIDRISPKDLLSVEQALKIQLGIS